MKVDNQLETVIVAHCPAHPTLTIPAQSPKHLLALLLGLSQLYEQVVFDDVVVDAVGTG